MLATTEFQRAIESATGETIKQLQETPIAERRRMVEKRLGRRMRFRSHWPFIGRGNIIHGDAASRDKVEADLDEALR